MSPPARFLVLLGGAPRALLFDATSRLLGEVIEDDGYIVAGLLDRARACPVPDAGMLDALDDALAPSPSQPVRCYELG